jgi:hypothetical protein
LGVAVNRLENTEADISSPRIGGRGSAGLLLDLEDSGGSRLLEGL